MSDRRTFSNDGVAFSPDNLAVGGRGPVRLTGTSPIVGKFKIIHAAGGAMVINNIQIDGITDSSWSGASLSHLDVPLFFGQQTVTRITLTSGEGRGYEV
jgi:hypothetical protein